MQSDRTIAQTLPATGGSNPRVTGKIPAQYSLRKWLNAAPPQKKSAYCQVLSLSPKKVSFIATEGAETGDIALVSIPGIGPMPGKISRTIGALCTLDVHLEGSTLDEIHKKISWMERKTVYGLRERRMTNRFRPENKDSVFVDLEGNVQECQVIDISVTGAGVRCAHPPRRGEVIWLGSVPGKVVRHLDDGFGMVFAEKQDLQLLPQLIADKDLLLV